MVNVRIGNNVDIFNNKAAKSAVAEVEAKLGDKGRVLLRPSGTEPLIRVMVEGEDQDSVVKFAKELAEVVAAEVSA
jgi:phosphoglucosamine mutase